MASITLPLDTPISAAIQHLQKQMREHYSFARQLTWDDVTTGYVRLVTEYVPGPLSLSYFVPFILLPLALTISPSRLSHQQLCQYFLPPIYASVFHAWYAMGGVDVISVDGLLWATLLIGFRDVREDFQLLVMDPPSGEILETRTSNGTVMANGVAERQRNDKLSTKRSTGRMSREAKSGNAVTHHGLQPTSQDGISAQPYPVDLFPRFKWVLTLLASTRFHGWLTGSSSRDTHQLRNFRRYPSRTQYVASILPWFVFTQCCLLPLTLQLAIYDPAVTSLSPALQPRHWLLPFSKVATPSSSTVRFLYYHVPAVILRPLTTGLYALGVLSGNYYQRAGFVVLSNYLFGLPSDAWSLHTLPDYFGPFSSVLDHGVGGFWGQWWHQHMRIMASGPGLALADFIGLTEQRLNKEGDSRRNVLWNCRYTLQVLSGFLFSGITHMGLVPPLVPGAMGLRLRIAGFFSLQAVAVILERLVTITFDKWGGNPRQRTSTHSSTALGWLQRALRLVWVLGWLCLTLQLLERPFDKLGWWKLYPPPGYPKKIAYYAKGDWIL